MNISNITGIIKTIDLRRLDSGKSVCNVWLEVQPPLETQSPFVIVVSAWDDLATEVGQFAEGDTLTIEGYLETETVEKENGIKQKTVSMTATRLAPASTVTLVGRVGGNPEVNQVTVRDEQTTVAKLTLAVNKRSRDKEESPNWFNLELWGRTAEVAREYVRKGSQIGVTGTLRIDTWKDRNTGDDRSKPVIRVSRLELLGSKQAEDSSDEEAAPAAAPAPAEEPVAATPAKSGQRKAKAEAAA